MEFWRDWKFWLVVVGTVVIAIISGVLSAYYDNYDKYLNSISPRVPRWVFPMMWSIIYVLTIIGTYLQIYFNRATNDLVYLTLGTWAVSVLCILFWVIALNVYDDPSGALIIACIYLFVVVVQTVVAFFMWPWAVLFYLPIIGWLSFAIYLNNQMVIVV